MANDKPKLSDKLLNRYCEECGSKMIAGLLTCENGYDSETGAKKLYYLMRYVCPKSGVFNDHDLVFSLTKKITSDEIVLDWSEDIDEHKVIGYEKNIK